MKHFCHQLKYILVLVYMYKFRQIQFVFSFHLLAQVLFLCGPVPFYEKKSFYGSKVKMKLTDWSVLRFWVGTHIILVGRVGKPLTEYIFLLSLTYMQMVQYLLDGSLDLQVLLARFVVLRMYFHGSQDHLVSGQQNLASKHELPVGVQLPRSNKENHWQTKASTI